ncbi:hypothetical protein, partial [Pseudomonas plecoglossicida]
RPLGAFGWFSYTTSRDTIFLNARAADAVSPSSEMDVLVFHSTASCVWVQISPGSRRTAINLQGSAGAGSKQTQTD